MLGPILFTCYIESLGELIRSHGIDYQIYADDQQFYIRFFPRNATSMSDAVMKIENCVKEVRIWLRDHMLKCNDEKTDMILISSRYRERPEFEGLKVGESFIHPSPYIRNLGVIFDDSFTWEKEVATKV